MTNQKPSSFPLASDDKYWVSTIPRTHYMRFEYDIYQKDINLWWKNFREFVESNTPEKFFKFEFDWDNENVKSYVEDLEGVILSIQGAIKK